MVVDLIQQFYLSSFAEPAQTSQELLRTAASYYSGRVPLWPFSYVCGSQFKPWSILDRSGAVSTYTMGIAVRTSTKPLHKIASLGIRLPRVVLCEASEANTEVIPVRAWIGINQVVLVVTVLPVSWKGVRCVKRHNGCFEYSRSAPQMTEGNHRRRDWRDCWY